MNIRQKLAVTALVLGTSVGIAIPAGAASQLGGTPTCVNNTTTATHTKKLYVQAPKIWSRNGGTQTVRYRHLLLKWNGSAYVLNETGVWHAGMASPNTAWHDATRSWDLTGKSAGYFRDRVQVQYYASGAYGNLEQGDYTSYQYVYVYKVLGSTATDFGRLDSFCQRYGTE